VTPFFLEKENLYGYISHLNYYTKAGSFFRDSRALGNDFCSSQCRIPIGDATRAGKRRLIRVVMGEEGKLAKGRKFGKGEDRTSRVQTADFC